MNKTAIKNFAVWARNKLIADISYRAGLIGITESGIASALPQSTGTTEFYDIGTAEPYSISGDAVRQRRRLVELIERKEKETDYKTAYKYIIEEVAYTWFNRLIAIRFMEVNDYLPSHIRVLSSESGKMEPDLVTTPFDADLDFTREEEQFIIHSKQDNRLDELFCMLFIKQCNVLNNLLPDLFEKTKDYSELLLNLSFTDREGVVYRLVNDIPEKDFNIESGGQVEIIGWLYQNYNTEPKADVDASVKKGEKVSKETMPAKTQIFTPDWIVRYLVENSLGRFWLDNLKNSENSINSLSEYDINLSQINELKTNWKYFVDEENQNIPEFKEKKRIKLEDVRFIDPCMGSGHILVYAFDLLFQLYEVNGYSKREAVEYIVSNNLWGLDIDKRAAQLSYFAVMMKARQYDRRFFNRKDSDGNLSIPQPHIYSIVESNLLDKALIEYSVGDNIELKNIMQNLVKELKDAREYGSTVCVGKYDFKALYERFSEVANQTSIFSDLIQRELLPFVRVGEVLSQSYNVAVTNPPYLALGDMSVKLAEYVKEYYADSKWDMFSVFIERLRMFTKQNGYYALITQPSIVTLSSFEKLRIKQNSEQTMKNLIHMGRGIFGVDFGSTAFVYQNRIPEIADNAQFFRLHEKTFQYIEPGDIGNLFQCVNKNKNLKCNFSLYDTKTGFIKEMYNGEGGRKLHFVLSPLKFNDIPGTPWIYEANEALLTAFSGNNLKDLATPKVGLQTGENNRFTRLWFEIDFSKIKIGAASREEAEKSGYKWFPYNKGGDYRKWYGNDQYVVNWENDGFEIRNFKNEKGKLKSRPQNLEYYFREAISWSKISAGSISFRYKEPGYIFDVAGTSFFAEKEMMYYLAGFCNSTVALRIAKMISPTMNYEVGHIASFPIIIDKDKISEVCSLVKRCISLCKEDWDDYEISWNFTRHPLVKTRNLSADAILLSDLYDVWKHRKNCMFDELREMERQISDIFEKIYGIEGDENALYDEAISITKANEEHDIKSLISYAVGCMFGRYSLDNDGLIFAGANWDNNNYLRYPVDEDNIIPICDEEYFTDDIVGKFISFIECAYGRETLEENLQYVASVLGGQGTARDVIREYFLNKFFVEHCSRYSGNVGKRPIYWLFDSGKKNGFKCLIYAHRYNVNTIGNLRIDYLHRIQRIYESEINRMQDTIDNSTNAREIASATKRKEKLQKQLKECREYDEKIGHLALSRIDIDLDDGVKVNYEKVQTASDGKKYQVLAKI